MGQKVEVIGYLFNPRSVAVIGVTDSPARVGYNLLESVVSAGFKGRIYPVHPRLEALAGLPVYRSLAQVPDPVDLAVVGVNHLAALEVVEECGRRGVKGVVLVAGGFKETGPQGEALEKKLVETARRYGMEIIGPNTLGLISTHAGLNATFYPLGELPRGRASFITQSGGVGLAILQKARDEGLGISKWVGVGNRSTLEVTDYLAYLARDESTSVIGLFLEGTEDAGRLARVAARVARQKPVVVYKVGRSGKADFAALTHTGSMAGSYRLYRQIFGEQFGLLMVESTLAMVAACKALALAPRPAGNGVGVVTHTAGPSIVFLDEVAVRGGTFPAFAPATMERIKEILGENPPVVLKNPLDAAGQGMQAATFGRLLEAVAQDPRVDLLAAIFCWHRHWRCPTPEILSVRERYGKPVVALYIGTLDEVRAERDALQGRGVPVYLTPEEAAWGAAALLHYALRREEGSEDDRGGV